MNEEHIEEGYVTRLREELFDLTYSYDRLCSFLDTSEAHRLSDEMIILMYKQKEIMDEYIDVLNDRLALIELEG